MLHGSCCSSCFPSLLQLYCQSRHLPFYNNTKYNFFYKKFICPKLKEKQFSKLDSLAPEYINYLKRILKDAFNVIFGIEVNTEYVEFSDPKEIKFTEEEYGSQKDRKAFVKKMCEFNPEIQFDLYNDEVSCKKKINKIGSSCV